MTSPAHIPGLAAAADRLPLRPLHLAVGMFDGVHLGHRAVVDAAVQSARRRDGLAAALTFWPHPSALFRPAQRVRLIMDDAARARALLALGVDAVITEPFTPEFAGIAAEGFLPHVRGRLPQLAAIHTGENFRFGQGRRGDIALLVAEGRRLGLEVFSAPRVNYNGEPVSSSRIREALAAGRVEETNTMLGRAYFATGVVRRGRRLGRALGYPTLNLGWVPDLMPRHGVYAVRVSGAQAPAPLPAVANYGLRPTVESDATTPQLEAHLLGECPFGEGDEITVEWLRFLRPEEKFAGPELLRTQIARDRAVAAEFFGL
jgi:riboflavin kinase/FMN adenylyltransferase